MFPEQLKKILQLIKRTGDRVIIFDGANPDDSYVIMDVDSYADGVYSDEGDDGCCGNCSDGCCHEEGDEIIAEASAPEEEKKPEIIEEKTENTNLTEEDLTDRINQEISMWKNQDNAQSLSEEDKVKKSWQIPPAVKDKAKNIE